MVDYKKQYLKYKLKYLQAKQKVKGGSSEEGTGLTNRFNRTSESVNTETFESPNIETVISMDELERQNKAKYEASKRKYEASAREAVFRFREEEAKKRRQKWGKAVIVGMILPGVIVASVAYAVASMIR
tara:strand:- start:3 stop:389 length:387 start_codon:yes stop_codon:yes gene_type:complete